MDALADRLRRGDRRSLARAMSLVDQAGDRAEELKDWLRRSTGQVPWWGFTGPPGVGKSTLIDAVLSMLRRKGCRIGVVAVDPTSPMSGGALLGDRVRMTLSESRRSPARGWSSCWTRCWRWIGPPAARSSDNATDTGECWARSSAARRCGASRLWSADWPPQPRRNWLPDLNAANSRCIRLRVGSQPRP